MKLLRVGELNQEIVVALDRDNKLRDLSGQIEDLNSKTLNENTLKKLEQINLSNLKEVTRNIRIGNCISNPVDFLANWFKL